MSRAIVLSGGGAVGIAWQTGLVAGLSAEGVDVSKADFVVGTSAGSAVGAQIALGRDMSKALERFARSTTASAPRPGAPRQGAASGSPERLQNLFAIMAKAMAEDGDPAKARAALGRYALEAKTVTEEQFLLGFGYLADERWPRAFSCTAVDAESGQFMVWNEASGVDLVRAVGSSCAVPGLFPPITLGGRRYMDGGMRSGTNADLAKGHDRVLILTLMGTSAAGAADGEGNPRLERMRRSRERELSVLRDSGAGIESVGPDAEAAAIMGMDLMNPALTHDAAQAGHRQGRAEAERLRAFWS